MSMELKIKALTLGYEARQIARFERKLKRMRRHIHKHNQRLDLDPPGRPPTREWTTFDGTNPAGYQAWGNAKLLSLQAHRRGVVRGEARRTHLARMFLKGTPYKRAEAKVHDGNRLTPDDWGAIHRMCEKYARFAKMSADSQRGEWRSVQQLAQAFEEWRQAE